MNKKKEITDEELEYVNGGNAIDDASDWIASRGKIISDDLEGKMTLGKAADLLGKGFGTGIGVVAIGVKGAVSSVKKGVKKGVKKVLDFLF